MVKEKIVSIKRNILLVIIHYLYNLEINSNLLALFGLYFFFLATSIIFGFWTVFGLISHVLFLIIYLIFFILLVKHIIKKIKYSNKATIIYWLEK